MLIVSTMHGEKNRFLTRSVLLAITCQHLRHSLPVLFVAVLCSGLMIILCRQQKWTSEIRCLNRILYMWENTWWAKENPPFFWLPLSTGNRPCPEREFWLREKKKQHEYRANKKNIKVGGRWGTGFFPPPRYRPFKEGHSCINYLSLENPLAAIATRRRPTIAATHKRDKVLGKKCLPHGTKNINKRQWNSGFFSLSF